MLLHTFPYGQQTARIYSDQEAMGTAAATFAAEVMLSALEQKPTIRIMIGTGNSQETTIDALTNNPDIPWNRVEVFHMDEYVGLSMDHPASFRRWLKERVADRVRPMAMHYLNGDAEDLQQELKRYTDELLSKDMDMSFIGFGENGHIAFNDPHVADFEDVETVKIVELDTACRQQQVGEGHYPDMESVPKFAMTVTCTGLLRAKNLVCVVPEQRKATAVRNALTGPVTTACPGSIVRTHPDANLFLDRDAASLLDW
jgi:glucosamine-6-phosphate deaminase